MEVYERPVGKPDGCRVVRDGDGARLRAVVWLLVHRLSCSATSDGRRFDVRGAENSSDCRSAKNVLSSAGDTSGNDRDRPHLSIGRERLCASKETGWGLQL